MKTSMSGVLWNAKETFRRNLDAENKQLLSAMFRDPLPVPSSAWRLSKDPKVSITANQGERR